MTLRQEQSLFVYFISGLIQFAYEKGYELTLGEGYRSKEEAARLAKLGVGIPNSLHGKRLAIDFNLFINGKYQTTTKAHQPLGEFWELLHPLCRWGGRFGDGNHYSMEYEGVK